LLPLDDQAALLGSLSMVSGNSTRIESSLPDWLERGVQPSLRDTVDESPPVVAPTAISSASLPHAAKGVSAAGSPIVLTPRASSPISAPSKGPWKDLDQFYEDIDNNQNKTPPAHDNDDSGSGDDESEESEESEDNISEEESDVESEEEDAESEEEGTDATGANLRPETQGTNVTSKTGG
jgi:AP-3 complex subunit beta